ncbi:hypothetical protein F5Y16DRAFT_365321 [Xylariaceae sp. FL0255]|nr:hypothetical protein F5Y16DRAFT_365321 [Xylariaceae sp. FL0255]
MAPPLLGVPLEVLLQITSYLTTPEFGNFRLTCTNIEAALFRAFTIEYFTKRQFTLTEFSIQALVDIARSRLGSVLTHLIIHLEHPVTDYYPGAPVLGIGGIPLRPQDQNALVEAATSHREFTCTGLDFEMLSDAMRHLPNLETIGMRDFNSNTRRRDGTSWRSYGTPTYEQRSKSTMKLPAHSVHRRGPDAGLDYVWYTFLTILRAIGQSNANPNLTRLEILLHRCSLQDHAFKLPRHLEANILSALGKFQTIYLDSLCLNRHVRAVSANNPVFSTSHYLSRFLAKATDVRNLRLNFQNYDYEATNDLLLWLAGAVPVTAASQVAAADSLPDCFPPRPSFSNLQSLDIGMATVSPRTLVALYRRFKSTLRSISLHKIALNYTHGSKINHWSLLLSDMAKSDLGLTNIQLSYVRQLAHGSHQPVSFGNGSVTFNSTKDRSIMTWSGTNFSRSLKDITSKMEVDWESQSSDNDFDDDDDDDSDEDNEDDGDSEYGDEDEDEEMDGVGHDHLISS